MRTELKIYGSNVWYNVDLYDDEPLPLTKEVKDLYEPDKSQSDFTKTIKIPGTQNNNKIFSNIFDINHAVIATVQFTNDFNPNLKANCILYREGVPQIRGYLQLTNINILDEWKVEYEIVVIGRNANLFQDLGDSKLIDLDLSEFNHVWNTTNIDASWTAPIGSGYVYPLIDRGFDPNEILYYYDQTYPAIYVKSIVDRIFYEAGYRYDSDFLTGSRFKRLIIPYTGANWRMTDAEVEDRLFELGFNSAGAYALNSATPQLIAFPNTIKDSSPTGVAASTFVIPTGYGGNYTFRTECDITVRYIGGATLSDASFWIDVRVLLNRGGTISVLRVQNQLIEWTGTIATNATKQFTLVNQTPIAAYEAGDILYCDWSLVCRPFPLISFTDFEARFNAGSAFFNSSDGQYNFGSTVSLSNALPTDVTQKDFLTSLIKMFNLYFEPDQIDDKKLIIEPRDEFYLSTVVDLTNKLDTSRDLQIVPMGALDFRTLEFHSQIDNDQLNRFYNDRYLNEYGYKRVTVSNDFLVEKKLVETIFAPSPLADADNNDRVVTKIRFYNEDGSLKTQAAKPRILYYGGLVNTGLGTYSLSTSRTTPNYRTQFAYAGHVDSVYNPQFDLSWSLPEMLLYGAGTGPTLTDGNLYNLYWKKTITEITDKNSKLLICYMRLNNVDLQNISFRNYFLINRQYYRLYKIETDLNSDEPAKCVFLKLNVAPTFTPSQGQGNGGQGEIGDNISPDLTFVNHNKFVETQKNVFLKLETVSTDSAVEPGAKFIKADADVWLPDAAACFDYISQKSGEISIYNISGGNITITLPDESTKTLAASTGTRFLSDGADWYQF